MPEQLWYPGTYKIRVKNPKNKWAKCVSNNGCKLTVKSDVTPFIESIEPYTQYPNSNVEIKAQFTTPRDVDVKFWMSGKRGKRCRTPGQLGLEPLKTYGVSTET
jgi:hypothetical protein